MRVRVLLFARYREAAGGRDSLEVEVPPGASLARLWAEVGTIVPALSREGAPLVAMGRSYARPDQMVEAGKEIAFFPPVSGG